MCSHSKEKFVDLPILGFLEYTEDRGISYKYQIKRNIPPSVLQPLNRYNSGSTSSSLRMISGSSLITLNISTYKVWIELYHIKSINSSVTFHIYVFISL